MKHEILHIKDSPDEYLVIVDESTPKVEDWCVERQVGKTEYNVNQYHKTQSNSWLRKVIAHYPMYDTKPLENVPLLPEPTANGKCRVNIDVATLYTIFNSGFNLGVNEGPFPKTGTYNSFHNTLISKPPMLDDASYYDIKRKIKLAKIPTEFIYEGYTTNKTETNWLGDYVFN